MTERPTDLLRVGQNLLARSRLGQLLGEGEPEALGREGLRVLGSAMNHLEDTSDFDVAHYWLDAGGRWIRRTFGCHLHREGTNYEQRCPAALAHKRIGFSIGMRNAVRLCSVCASDARACRHVAGKTYDASRFLLHGRYCNVCGLEGCDHLDGETYPVVCWRLVVAADLEEVSMVRRPAHPDARLTAIPMSTREIAMVLGSGWEPGMDVTCDFCLTPCNGVTELPDTLTGSRS